MNKKNIDFFLKPENKTQLKYEVVRAIHVDNLEAEKVAEKFGIKKNYVYTINRDFYKYIRNMKNRENPYFKTKKPGPKQRRTDNKIKKKIIQLRKRNCSVDEIKIYLQLQGEHFCLQTIYNILKDAGYPPLSKRSKEDRISQYIPPDVISPPRSKPIDLTTPFVFDTNSGGLLIFLQIVKDLGLSEGFETAGYPSTDELSSINYILSLLALKLNNTERLSDANAYALDRGLGLFAGLNVIPKASSLSSYSYRVSRGMNVSIIKQMINKLNGIDEYSGIINLDFKSIPHWGDVSNLENHWVSSRGKSMKSALTLITQDQKTGFLAYTDSQRNHKNKNDSILEFVDFWRENEISLKCLIFDSKFTTYQNLNKLNQDHILFITLRRRGKKLVQDALKVPEGKWKKIYLGKKYKRKHRNIKTYSHIIKLKDYPEGLREIIIKDHGRAKPTFLITNDMKSSSTDIIKKYARRWLIEQHIAEQIAFFNLNKLSSSIVVKIDFDITLSFIAHSIYRIFARQIYGFQSARPKRIYTHFIDNAAKVTNCPDEKKIIVSLKKKVHIPLILETFLANKLRIPWLNNYVVQYDVQNTT